MYITEAMCWPKLELTGSMLRFFTVVFAIHLCFGHRRIVHASLMVLEAIPQVYKTDAAAQIHTMPDQHIFTLLSLLPLMDEHESRVKSIMAITITAIVMITTISILICIWKRCRYSSSLMRLCYPLYLVSRWLCGTLQINISVQVANLQTSKTIWAHFCIHYHISNQSETQRIS